MDKGAKAYVGSKKPHLHDDSEGAIDSAENNRTSGVFGCPIVYESASWVTRCASRQTQSAETAQIIAPFANRK